MLFESERKQLVGLCVELSHKGYFAGTGGNIMVRTDATHVLVTPSALDYLTMSAADICVLRLADLIQVEGERTPSVETAMHAGIFQRRQDIGCSIHTHQPVASACAVLGEDVLVPQGMQASLGPRVPVVGYGPSGTSLLARKVARAIRPDINAYLLKNHGVICIGEDSQGAAFTLDQLEALSRQHLYQLISARKSRQGESSSALARLLHTLHPGSGKTA